MLGAGLFGDAIGPFGDPTGAFGDPTGAFGNPTWDILGIRNQPKPTKPFFAQLGKGSKPPGTETFRGGGGGTPLSVRFSGTDRPWRGEGGYPPFPLRKNPLKIGPKTVFFGQKSPFSTKKFPFSETDCPWRGYPPFPLTFPANFSEKSRPWRPRGRGGGDPPNGKFPCLGFLNPSLSNLSLIGRSVSRNMD